MSDATPYIDQGKGDMLHEEALERDAWKQRALQAEDRIEKLESENENLHKFIDAYCARLFDQNAALEARLDAAAALIPQWRNEYAAYQNDCADELEAALEARDD
jgi:predicted  nucleic acid-binding Zn-ribbon protein